MTQLVHQFVESVKLGRSALAETILSEGKIQHTSSVAAEPAPSAATVTDKPPTELTNPVCFSAASASFTPSVTVTANAASSSTAEKEEAKTEPVRVHSSGWGPWAKTQLAAWRAPYYMTGARNRNTSPVKPMNEFHNWVKDGIYRQHLRSVQLHCMSFPTLVLKLTFVFSSPRPGDAVLELAGGRGGDMWKHAKYRAREVLLTDVDEKALLVSMLLVSIEHIALSAQLIATQLRRRFSGWPRAKSETRDNCCRD